MIHLRPSHVGLIVAVVVGVARSASAVVDAIDATAKAEVQEFLGDSPGGSDVAFEDWNQTTGNLPLTAEAELFLSEAEADTAGATATTIFYDPRLGSDPDPDEFSIDLGTFSLSPTVSYLATSNSAETREITFGADEIGEAEGTDLEVRSQFFVDGLLLLWGDQGQTDLTGSTAEVTLSVQQTLPGSAEPTTLLSASLRLVGQADGTVTLSTSGALSADNLVVTDLSGSLAEFGPMHLVVIPASTALSYVYPAVVGEQFTLKAEVSGQARCQPGTGAAVQLGVPLLELATLLNTLAGGEAGSLLTEILAETVTSSLPPARPLPPASETTTVKVVRRKGLDLPLDGWLPFCGSLGIELPLLLGLGFGAAGLVSWRRR